MGSPSSSRVKDGSPAELESYLERYLEGTFASLARTRLDATALSPAGPSAPTPEEVAAEALDLAFWNSVKDSNRRESFRPIWNSIRTAISPGSPGRASLPQM